MMRSGHVLLFIVLIFPTVSFAQPQHIYWTDSEEDVIYRGAADGSSYQPLLAQRDPGTFTTRDSLIYWVDRLSNTLNRTVRGTADTDTLVSVTDVRGLAISADGEIVYWAAVEDTVTHVHALDLSADVRDTVLTVSGEGVPFEINDQTEEIYWMTEGAMHRRALENGTPETLLEDLTAPTRLTLDEDNNHIYWISEGTIYRSNTDGSGVEDLGAGASRKAVLDVPNQRYYWIQGDTLIKRAGMGGSSEQVIAEKPASPYTNIEVHAIKQLRLDTKNNLLYWRGGSPITSANLWQFDVTRNTVETAFVGFRDPSGLTVDPEAGHLYITAGQGKVLRSDLNGDSLEELVQVPCGIGKLTDIVFDSGRDRLYWGHETDCPSYDIYRSDLAGTDVAIVKGYNQPRGLALDSEKGELYWSEHTPYSLERADVDSLFQTQQTTDIADDIHPWGVGINAETNRIYWSDPYANAIMSADVNGQNREVLRAGLNEPRDLSLDVNGGAMYWIEQGSGTIRTATLDGSTPETLFSRLSSPEYMATTFATTRVLATDRPAELPQRVHLRNNFPNPFNPSTSIRYELPRRTKIELSVYDVMGRRVATLVDRIQAAGSYTVSFEGGDLPSGMYIYRLETSTQTLARQMLLVK
jgi:sugar lactone lactonase YvrE